MFCPNCGASVQGRFCAKCGTAVDPGSAPPGPGSAPPPGASPYGAGTPPGAQPYSASTSTTGGIADNVAGALCYLLWVITGILFLVLAPYNQNKFVRFHAFQSIFVTAAFFALWIVVGILSSILPWFMIGMIIMVLQLAGLGLWLILMFKAYQNERFKLPIVGDLAEKQA